VRRTPLRVLFVVMRHAGFCRYDKQNRPRRV